MVFSTGAILACYCHRCATGVLLARYSWRVTGAILACYWRDIGPILARYWRGTGVILALYWRDTGVILAYTVRSIYLVEMLLGEKTAKREQNFPYLGSR